MKKGKLIRIVFVVLFIAIQFFHPVKNISTEVPANKIIAPTGVEQILKTSCYDCHSNNTVYPWYNNIQPVAWWLDKHIKKGKRKLNFDEFLSYNPKRQYHKMDEIEENISKSEMPLRSYLVIHKNAILSTQQKDALINWSKQMRADLETKYPKDSLVTN